MTCDLRSSNNTAPLNHFQAWPQARYCHVWSRCKLNFPFPDKYGDVDEWGELIDEEL